jgi:hypothetical protein
MQHWYAVYGHPDGLGAQPWFAVDELTGLIYPYEERRAMTFAAEPCLHIVDDLVYPIGSNTDDEQPWFEIRGSCVYSTGGHPRGASSAPWYQMR